MALQRLDFERRTIPDIDVNLETTPYVVRAISKLGFWNGIVYSHFPRSVAEAVIADEISYFATLRRSFEWKVYSHDEPPERRPGERGRRDPPAAEARRGERLFSRKDNDE